MAGEVGANALMQPGEVLGKGNSMGSKVLAAQIAKSAAPVSTPSITPTPAPQPDQVINNPVTAPLGGSGGIDTNRTYSQMFGVNNGQGGK